MNQPEITWILISRAKARRDIRHSKKTSWSNTVHHLSVDDRDVISHRRPHETSVRPDEIHYQLLKHLPESLLLLLNI